MPPDDRNLKWPLALVRLLAAGLVLKTIVVVVGSYPSYFPPDFRFGFLLGRQDDFHGLYRFAFFVHVLTGPLSLALGLFLLSGRARRAYPVWHRRVGRVQVATVALFVAPSGLVMAFSAGGGTGAAWGFALLSLLTGWTVVRGYQAAVARRFAEHQRWMIRCFALLSSAVVLRIIGGIAEISGVEGAYPFAAWLSWVIPLALVELWRLTDRPSHRLRS